MRRSVKLRPNLWDGLVALAVILMAVACGISVWNQGDTDGRLTAIISIDGIEADRILLADEEEHTYTGSGYTLQAVLSKDGVTVRTSDCPTQDCVHTGTITRAGQSIVCLPARIIITLEGTAAEDGGPDLVIG